MANVEGSKDGSTWEETIRKDCKGLHRFSDRQYVKNLILLKNWCEQKIVELNAKINENNESQA